MQTRSSSFKVVYVFVLYIIPVLSLSNVAPFLLQCERSYLVPAPS